MHECELKTETLRKSRVLPLNFTNGVKARTSHRQTPSKLNPVYISTKFLTLRGPQVDDTFRTFMRSEITRQILRYAVS